MSTSAKHDPATRRTVAVAPLGTASLEAMRREAQVREQLERCRARLDGFGRTYASFKSPGHARVPSPLIDFLRRSSRLPVEEARSGTLLRAGTITLPPAGSHIRIVSGGRVVLEPRLPGDLVCPSADSLFASIAASRSARHIAVVLTGYGADGSFGTRAFHAMGGTVIAEDAATAAFPDMPGSACQLGQVDFTLPLEHIAFAIAELCGTSGEADALA